MSTRWAVPAGSLVAGRRGERDEAHRYLGRVLRLTGGDRMVLFDGAGMEADAVVTHIDSDTVWLAVEPPRPAPPRQGAELVLIASLLKADKLDRVVQKATELGVAAILPVESAHAVVQLAGDRADKRVARWRMIAREAARQCGRADVPPIAALRPLAEVVSAVPETATRLVFHEGAGTMPLVPTLAAGRHERIFYLVGPEGGLSAAELATSIALGFTPVGLGPRVLRAETACLAATVALGLLAGDLAAAPG
jgi:16S rRNA (uracil1498-N3)-methyltransferase